MALPISPLEPKPLRHEKEYYSFLCQSLGIVSLLIGLLICYLAQLSMQTAEELALTNEEVLAVAEPASRLLAKSKLDERARVALTSSGDSIGLAAALGAYVMRITSLIKEQHHVNPDQTTRVPNAQQRTTEPTYSTNGFSVADVAGFGSYTVS